MVSKALKPLLESESISISKNGEDQCQSHVKLECADPDARGRPRPRQPDEVLAPDVAGEERSANLGTKGG